MDKEKSGRLGTTCANYKGLRRMGVYSNRFLGSSFTMGGWYVYLYL